MFHDCGTHAGPMFLEPLGAAVFPAPESLLDDQFEADEDDGIGSGYYRYEPGRGIVFIPFTNGASTNRS